MPHKIEISDKTYDRLKEYCSLNGLRVSQFADKLIFDGLMIEMYGDVPFTDYKKPLKQMVEIPVPVELTKQEETPPEIQEVIDNHFFEMLDDDKKEEEPKPKEEILKEAGVPTKVVNKITKRRLK